MTNLKPVVLNNNPGVILTFRMLANKQSEGLSGTFCWLAEDLNPPFYPQVFMDANQVLYLDHPTVGQLNLGKVIRCNSNRAIIAPRPGITERTRKQLELVVFHAAQFKHTLKPLNNTYSTSEVVSVVYSPVATPMGNRKVNGMFYLIRNTTSISKFHRVVKYIPLVDNLVEVFMPETHHEKAVHLGVWSVVDGCFKPVKSSFVDNFIHSTAVHNLSYMLTLHSKYHFTNKE